MNNLYGLLNEYQLHIDKTSELEKGIVVFPSIYIEGAAASGKTTAVKMLLHNHPEVQAEVIWIDELDGGNLLENKLDENNLLESRLDGSILLKSKLDIIQERMEQQPVWLILENVNQPLPEETCRLIKAFIRHMPPKGRTILIGRECPQEELLDLIWKREMELISQETFLFTRNDVQHYLEKSQSTLKTSEVYEVTGGWPGCVDMMVRFSGKQSDAKQLRRSFEIDTYIEREIIGSLDDKERLLVEQSRICPWITPQLCQEMWESSDTKETFESLKRKGIFYYNKIKDYHQLNPLFYKETEQTPQEHWIRLSSWYEQHGDVREAFSCIKKAGKEEAYREFVIRHYDQIPFLDVEYEEVMSWEQECLEVYYLKGMYSYSVQQFEHLRDQIELVEEWIPSDEEEMDRKREIYLYLQYVNSDITLGEWMEMLEKEKKLRLYSMAGSGYSFLCGLRDISGLFACSKKEESRYAKIWKEAFGEQEWYAYRIARMDYYMETKREESLQEEDKRILYDSLNAEPWRYRLAVLYLLCKWPALSGNEQAAENIHHLEQLLYQEENDLCTKNTESIVSLYSPWWNEPERLSRWLRYSEEDSTMQVDDKNYMQIFARAKGYLLLNHFEKAERILEKLLPYLQSYHRYRYFAEALFGMAIVNWSKGKKGQAIRFMMESFLVTGNSRYVGFYVRYGKKGREVLESYVDWIKQTTPEGWHRKKKYNYGNVLRMPMEDYLEVILRGAKKETKLSTELSKGRSSSKGKNTERLTMMETIILQSISRGLTNTEICQEQNLKLPTVKSHIYSLYKKLGVSSRVQAVNKGKEMGIVR